MRLTAPCRPECPGHKVINQAPGIAGVHARRGTPVWLIGGRPDAHDLAIPPPAADALDLLPGCYDDWALIERERIRQRVLHALEALSDRLTAAARFADAIEAAMLAASGEPLRESARRTLLKAHIAEGNLTEARRVYLAYEALVQRELGGCFVRGPCGWPGYPAGARRRRDGRLAAARAPGGAGRLARALALAGSGEALEPGANVGERLFDGRRHCDVLVIHV
jgi:hypothetical protein